MGDIASAEFGEGLHAELLFAVFVIEEEDTVGGLAVASGASGFLEIIFEGARGIGMDDEADVVFIDSHTEGIGGTDDLGMAVEEAVLGFLFFGGCEAGVEVGGDPAFGAEVIGGEFCIFAGGAEDDGAAGLVGGEAFGEEEVGAFHFSRARDGLDFEAEVSAFDATFEELEVACGFGFEVGDNFVADVAFSGGGEAGDGGYRGILGLGEFADEASGVEVIGAEVVSPFGEAVGFVEDPATDFALGDGILEGAVAELFRGDIEDGDIAGADAAEDIGAFGGGEESVEGGGEGGSGAADEAVDLVFHEGLEWGDDDGEGSASVVAGECGELVAEGFAAAGGEDSEEGFFAHAGFDDFLLEAGSGGGGGGGAEVIEAEESFELLVGVMGLLAIGAGGELAGDFAEVFEDLDGGGVAEADPGWEDGVGAGDAEPGEGVGEGVALGAGLGVLGLEGEAGAGPAWGELVGEVEGVLGLGDLAAEVGEHEVHSLGEGIRGVFRGSEEEVQQGEEVGFGLGEAGEGAEFVFEEFAGEGGIGKGVIDAFAEQFVVLDEAVVGIFGEGDGGEDERIDDGEFEDGVVGVGLPDGGEVMVGEVMAEDGGGVGDEVGEGGEEVGGGELAGGGEGAVVEDCAEFEDFAVGVDFEVEEERVGWGWARRMGRVVMVICVPGCHGADGVGSVGREAGSGKRRGLRAEG
ncbi:MAG: hypothetical protein RI897_3545 [Verrucomicrobiota bacterium]